MKFQKIINEVIDSYIKDNIMQESYKLSDLDELMEYMWLRPKYTTLNVDILVDDGGSYERNGHPLLLFVRNGYDKSVAEFIPISVSNEPRVLDDEMDFNISYEDLFSVMDFIQTNIQPLTLLAQSQISHDEFAAQMKTVPVYAVVESKQLISEMATLKSEDSGLPVDIWLDEGTTYPRHAPWIKFRASNEQRTTREFASMLITDPTRILNMPKNSPIRKHNIEKIQEFVTKNRDLLLQLANGEIEYRTGFFPRMVK